MDRMNGKSEFKGDVMKTIEKEEYSKFKQNRDKYGVMVYKMIKEKNKKEIIKHVISNNAFLTYADKCLQNKS